MRFPNFLAAIGLGAALALAIGPVPMASAQQANCALPQEIHALATGLAMLPENGRVTPSQAQTIDRRLRNINENSILQELQRSGLETVSPVVVDLLAEAQRIASNSTLRNNGSLRETLYRLEQQVAMACLPGAQTMYQRVQQTAVSDVFRGEEVDWEEIERILQENKTVSASALLVALAGFIVVLYIFDVTFRWIMALVYNRKICRIPAEISVDGRIMRGHVVTLGRGGCRFYVRDTAIFEDVHVALLRDGATLVAGEAAEFRLEVLGRNIHDLAVDLAFDENLTLRQQREILKLSSVTPYHVTKSRDGGHEITDALGQEDDAIEDASDTPVGTT